MNVKWFTIGVLAVSALTCRGAAQSPAELLEKGIYTQETVGDLDRAIEIYHKILTSSPSARTYAAQAQYRLAQCLLQKGAKIEAAREFKRVVDVYSEERDLAGKARESLLPLAHYLEADYYDPALGVSFTSADWPVSEVMRMDAGDLEFFGPGVQISLRAIYNPPRFPHRVDMPVVFAWKGRAQSAETLFEEYQKKRCKSLSCHVLSTAEVNGHPVLRLVSGQFPNSLNDNAVSLRYGVLMRGEKTQLLIEAIVPVQELERNQAIIERILESVRMP